MKPCSDRFWFGALLFLLCGCLLAARWTARHTGTVAVISLDGVEVYRVDLATVRETYRLEYTGQSGLTNTVEIVPGAIRVREATCPDQVCVHQGWLRSGAVPIVCLPNALMVRLVGDAPAPDGITR